MTQGDWKRSGTHTLGVFLNGDELTEATLDGRGIVDDSFLLLFNAHFEDVELRLPNQSFGREWTLELSTADGELPPGTERFAARATLPVTARSLVLLKRAPPSPKRTPSDAGTGAR
jgi:glycogen operon protein